MSAAPKYDGPKFVGLYGPVWVTLAELETYKEELRRIALLAQLGEPPTALQKLAYELLKANDRASL